MESSYGKRRYHGWRLRVEEDRDSEDSPDELEPRRDAESRLRRTLPIIPKSDSEEEQGPPATVWRKESESSSEDNSELPPTNPMDVPPLSRFYSQFENAKIVNVDEIDMDKKKEEEELRRQKMEELMRQRDEMIRKQREEVMAKQREEAEMRKKQEEEMRKRWEEQEALRMKLEEEEEEGEMLRKQQELEEREQQQAKVVGGLHADISMSKEAIKEDHLIEKSFVPPMTEEEKLEHEAFLRERRRLPRPRFRKIQRHSLWNAAMYNDLQQNDSKERNPSEDDS